jgi:hypothetical protein
MSGREPFGKLFAIEQASKIMVSGWREIEWYQEVNKIILVMDKGLS